MALTVYDAMKLNNLRNFRLIAGQLGLDRHVTGTGILDYEFYGDIPKEITTPFNPGQLVLTSLLYSREDGEVLYQAVRRLIDLKVTALAIKTIFLKELPETVRQLADEERFPIFLFDNTVFFEDIIAEVAESIKNSDRLYLLEQKLDGLIRRDLSAAEIRAHSRDINERFKPNLVAFFCEWDGGGSFDPERICNAALESRNRDVECSILRYRLGLMVLISDDSEDMKSFRAKFSDRMAYSGLSEDAFIVGYSSCRNSKDGIAQALQEAVWAHSVCRAEKLRMAAFRETGTYRLLLPHLDSPWLEEYRAGMLSPLETYDRENSTELVRTAVAWVQCRGSLKKAAEILFVHENTVRYRINRIHTLVCPDENEWVFYEQLASAVRLKLLKNTGVCMPIQR